MTNPLIRIQHADQINWLNGSACEYVLGNSTDIWRVNINSNIQYIADWQQLLSEDEHDRAKRYYREQDRQRFIISRAALRKLIGCYTNADPKTVVFETGKNKKPFVKGSSIHYNLSHSGGQVLIAISGSEVGVDVEQYDPDIHYQDIMTMSYSKPEVDFINTADNPLEAFYLLWTRKEALLKATSKGIDDSFKFAPSVDGVHPTMFNVIGSDKHWFVSSFKVDETHTGAIASQNSEYSFREFYWKG